MRDRTDLDAPRKSERPFYVFVLYIPALAFAAPRVGPYGLDRIVIAACRALRRA